MEKIIIFGTAKRGDEVFAILSQLPDYEIAAFSCNDQALWGTEKEGRTIIPPGDMRGLYPDAIVVIASGSHVEIERQLVENRFVPGGGCRLPHQLIAPLSRVQRAALAAAVKRKTSFYNLDYREVAVPSDNGGGEKYLVICGGGYPTAGNPRCMFAHERVLQYRRAGLQVEAFGLVEGASFEEYAYEGVRVFQGGELELEKFLQGRNYRKILIHFISPEIMQAIDRAGKRDVPVIVWCHGFEALPWYQCWFNYTWEEIKETKPAFILKDSEKKDFLRKIYASESIHTVFVSEWLMNRSAKFAGRLPKNYHVIHNFIDYDFFTPPERVPGDRFSILSIKNHGTPMYANDLTAKAIIELSERSCFSNLRFHLYGDGKLFEENFGELAGRNFPNVHIHKQYLNHAEMRRLFQLNGIFLSPTRRDTQGVTANEAMAAGMAVISCNTSAIPEFMDESCASLFEYDNYWMMAEEIEYLYEHPEEFMRKAENARKRMMEQCSYDKTIKRELELISTDD